MQKHLDQATSASKDPNSYNSWSKITKDKPNILKEQIPSSSKNKHSNQNSPDTLPSKTLVVYKGRGEVSDGSKMDKYFRKDYDPTNDLDPLFEECRMISYESFEKNLKEKTGDDSSSKKNKKKSRKEKSKHKKKKHKSKKSKKKRKDKYTDSDSGSDYISQKKKKKDKDTDSDGDSRKKRNFDKIREWDLPKMLKDTDADSDSKEKKKDILGDNIREWDRPKLVSGFWDFEKH